MFSFIKKIWTYIYCRGKFYHRRHGEQMLLGGLMACVLIATMALKSTGMDSMSLSAFTTAGDITVAQEYALSRAESVRALKYDYLSSVPLRAIDGSNGFYEEIDVSDSEISTGVSGGYTHVRQKV